MAGMENNTEGRRDGVWAQPYVLASGQTQFHELGHIRLWVTLLDQEWQVRSEMLDLDTDRNHRPYSAICVCAAAAVHSGTPVINRHVPAGSR